MKGSILALACLTLVFGAAIGLISTRSFRHNGPAQGIRIGIPDDTGGLVIQVMAARRGLEKGVRAIRFEPHPFKDCCSTSSEWALSSEDLDGAVMCPDAATRLVERDDRFEVVGPCLLNSDALVTRAGATPTRVGVAHKRRYQAALVRERFGDRCGTTSMLPSSLPYALARELVDAIVLDGLKAISIPEPRLVSALGGRTIVTCVLTMLKDPHRSPWLRPFVDEYGRTASALNDPAVLAHWVRELRGWTWNEKEIREWKSLNVQFVSPWVMDFPAR